MPVKEIGQHVAKMRKRADSYGQHMQQLCAQCVGLKSSFATCQQRLAQLTHRRGSNLSITATNHPALWVHLRHFATESATQLTLYCTHGSTTSILLYSILVYSFVPGLKSTYLFPAQTARSIQTDFVCYSIMTIYRILSPSAFFYIRQEILRSVMFVGRIPLAR